MEQTIPKYAREVFDRINPERENYDKENTKTPRSKETEQKRCVVVNSYEPTDESSTSSDLPFLRFNVGDRILVVKTVGDWAVGRLQHDANSDFGMFPLQCVQPLRSGVPRLESEVLDTLDRWAHFNRRLYIQHGSKVEYEKGVEYISRLLEFLKTRLGKFGNVIQLIDEGNQFFGAGICLRRKSDLRIAPEDFNLVTAIEYVKRRRTELRTEDDNDEVHSFSHQDLDLQVPTGQSKTSVLLKFKTRSTANDFALDVHVLDRNKTPAYRRFCITESLTGHESCVLLENVESVDFCLQIEAFELVCQELPGRLNDEFSHTQFNAVCSATTWISELKNFKRTLDLILPEKKTKSRKEDEEIKANIQIKIHGEVIKTAGSMDLTTQFGTRNCLRLLPLASRFKEVEKRREDSNTAQFTFHLAEYLNEFKQVAVIVECINSRGETQQGVFNATPGSKNLASNKLLFYNFDVGSLNEPRPKDLHVQINLPTEENSFHLRLILSTTKNKVQELHLAFLKIVDRERLVKSGATNLLVYKIDSSSRLRQMQYLKLADRKQEHRGALIRVDDFTPLDHQIPTHVTANSLVYTHDPNVLFLLNSMDCHDQKKIETAIMSLISSSTDLSVFVSRIFQRLFSKIGMSFGLDKEIFNLVSSLMLRAEQPNETHLKTVIKNEVERIENRKLFSSFLPQLLTLITAELRRPVEIGAWLDALQITSPMVALILHSTSVYIRELNKEEVVELRRKLRSDFYLLLNTITYRLDNNVGNFMSDRWTAVKSLPLTFDLLLAQEVVTPHFMVNFSIRLLESIPDDEHWALILTARALVQTDLFKSANYPPLTLSVIPAIRSCLESGTNQPKTSFCLLNTTIVTLSNLMVSLYPKLEKSDDPLNGRREFFTIVDSCFLLIVRCCNLDKIQVQCHYVLGIFLEFIDSTCFAHYLSHLPPSTDVQDVLCQLIFALRSLIEPSTHSTFNDPSLRWILNRLVVKMFGRLTACFTNNWTLPRFSLLVWKELLHCQHTFFLNSTSRVAFGIYDERNAGLRVKVAEQIRSLWFLLPIKKKKALLKNMLELVIDLLLCIGSTRQIRFILMPAFSDVIATAYAEKEGEAAMGIADLYKILHHRLLNYKRKRRTDEKSTVASEMKQEVEWMLESAPVLNKNAKARLLPQFLSLIDYARQALETKSSYHFEIVHSELISFAQKIDEQSLRTDLEVKIYVFQHDRGLFVEAGFGLQNCVKNLSWEARPLDFDAKFISGRLNLSCRDQQELKVALYQTAVGLFQRAQAWEFANDLLKELAKFYEEKVIDYKELSKTLEQMQQNYEKIETTPRVECPYYLVCFHGQHFPKYLQNKSYVMRALPSEMFSNFRQRLNREFGCEMIADLAAEQTDLEKQRGKFVKMAPVQPVPSTKLEHLLRSANPLVPWFYRHNCSDTFDLLRPFQEENTKWTRLKETDTTKAWVRRTRFRVQYELPSALSFSEVIEEIQLSALNPPQVACKTVGEANKQLDSLTKMVEQGLQGGHLTQLIGQVRGVLQAYVGGGVSNYEVFFSAAQHTDLDADEIRDIEELKKLLIRQVELLDFALRVHEKFGVSDETREFHNALIESFVDFRRIVQRISSCECENSKPLNPTPESSAIRSPASLSVSLGLPPRFSNRHSSQLRPPTA